MGLDRGGELRTTGRSLYVTFNPLSPAELATADWLGKRRSSLSYWLTLWGGSGMDTTQIGVICTQQLMHLQGADSGEAKKTSKAPLVGGGSGTESGITSKSSLLPWSIWRRGSLADCALAKGPPLRICT